MYVGITRAQKTLALAFASKRKQFGEPIDCTPSRFLDELPTDDIKWIGKDADSTPADKEKTLQYDQSFTGITEQLFKQPECRLHSEGRA